MLNKSAKRINAEYEERHNAKTVSQIREFIGKLGTIQTEHQALRIRIYFIFSNPNLNHS